MKNKHLAIISSDIKAGGISKMIELSTKVLSNNNKNKTGNLFFKQSHSLLSTHNC